MLPVHPQAMPVILDNIEAQKDWLLNGNCDLLVSYTGRTVAEYMRPCCKNGHVAKGDRKDKRRKIP
jgi:hypothetical protein